MQVDAQVMLLKNLELGTGQRMLVNGSRGVVVDFVPTHVSPDCKSRLRRRTGFYAEMLRTGWNMAPEDVKLIRGRMPGIMSPECSVCLTRIRIQHPCRCTDLLMLVLISWMADPLTSRKAGQQLMSFPLTCLRDGSFILSFASAWTCAAC